MPLVNQRILPARALMLATMLYQPPDLMVRQIGELSLLMRMADSNPTRLHLHPQGPTKSALTRLVVKSRWQVSASLLQRLLLPLILQQKSQLQLNLRLKNQLRNPPPLNLRLRPNRQPRNPQMSRLKNQRLNQQPNPHKGRLKNRQLNQRSYQHSFLHLTFKVTRLTMHRANL